MGGSQQILMGYQIYHNNGDLSFLNYTMNKLIIIYK